MTERIITLKCEDDSKNYDQNARQVIVWQETADAWEGWPLIWRTRRIEMTQQTMLTWPKFAWKEMQAEPLPAGELCEGRR